MYKWAWSSVLRQKSGVNGSKNGVSLGRFRILLAVIAYTLVLHLVVVGNKGKGSGQIVENKEQDGSNGTFKPAS